MKSYLRNLDPLGRISIPKEILSANLIEDDTLFLVKAVPEGILLVPAEGVCVLCGEAEDLLETGADFICRSC